MPTTRISYLVEHLGATVSGMDLASLLQPGAQNLASAMLSDAWAAVRGAIAHKWGRGDADSTDQMANELDSARADAMALVRRSDAGSSALPEPQQRDLALYWAGFLRRMLEDRPDMAEAIAGLPTVIGTVHRTEMTVGSGTAQVIHGGVQGSVYNVEKVEGGFTVTNN
jgi:hypothetical protein